MDRLDGFDLVIPSLPGYGFSERPDAHHHARHGEALARADAGPRLRALRRGRHRLGRGGHDLHGARRPGAAARHPPLEPRQLARGGAGDRRRARLRGRHRALGRDRTRLQLPAGHTPADAGLRADGLTGRPRGVDPREVARVGGHRRRARARLRPRLPARAGDALLGHRHDRHLHARLPRQPRGRHGHAARARRPCPPAIANFHHSFVPEGTLPREWAERIFNVDALHRHAARRPLRRRRAAGPAGGGDHRLLRAGRSESSPDSQPLAVDAAHGAGLAALGLEPDVGAVALDRRRALRASAGAASPRR